MAMLPERDLPTPAALVLFSPEIDLDLDHPSITDNAARDILPWNVPVTPYLHGVQPEDARVSAVFAPPDPERFPPTFVCAGGDEMFRDGKNVYTEHFQTEANETDPNLAPGTTKIKEDFGNHVFTHRRYGAVNTASTVSRLKCAFWLAQTAVLQKLRDLRGGHA